MCCMVGEQAMSDSKEEVIVWLKRPKQTLALKQNIILHLNTHKEKPNKCVCVWIFETIPGLLSVDVPVYLLHTQLTGQQGYGGDRVQVLTQLQ